MSTKINMINLSYIDEYVLDQNISSIIIDQSRYLLDEFVSWYNKLDKISDINRQSTNVYTSAIFFSYLNCMLSRDNESSIIILRRAIKDTQFKMKMEEIE